MILNNETILSDQQAITASAASTNVFDFGQQGTPHGDAAALSYDFGIGEPIPIIMEVNAAFDSAAGDSTLTIAFQLDSTTTFTPDETIDLGTFTEAQLVAGFKFPIRYLPRRVNLRYGRFYYTVAGTGNFTAGKITAQLGHHPQEN